MTTTSSKTANINAKLTEAEITAVQDIVIEQLQVAREQVTPEAALEADLGADSLDMVEILMKTEERFGVTVPDAMAEGVKTVEDLYDALAQVLGR
jgi:acyl carrier protein